MGCFATVAALGASLFLAAGGDQRLTIGTEAPFPPYIMTDASGALTGFEYQLMQEICQRKQFRCDWESTAFEELVPGVMDGRFDVVLGGMAITPERRALVDFSMPYQQTDDTEWFIGPPSAPLPEVARIAVQSGTLHEAWLRQNGFDFRAYRTEADVLSALRQGAADLAFGPFERRADLAAYFSETGTELLYEVPIGDEGTAMAVCKGNAPLLAQLNEAIRQMQADGTIAALELRWF
ncbi:transporter substrate-binding domain-containing protein [Xinfangfangia sp. CPCC 101601]|uniref:Transporter substrate-binding domain-containing protein n=1 Tax=Pseudogemmobacter lacusdianii TaxID=3069608 RepID=A0ABU0VVH4_9RHOB|nr:transporter substrate-binding domain-containing protein [Xinfangfangia sp. CPCC 101601]MDQ2065746.1 transporter substrate-binding domain-containing protein [Xinfangfangia sp. CPCC 101601]